MYNTTESRKWIRGPCLSIMDFDVSIPTRTAATKMTKMTVYVNDFDSTKEMSLGKDPVLFIEMN